MRSIILRGLGRAMLGLDNNSHRNGGKYLLMVLLCKISWSEVARWLPCWPIPGLPRNADSQCDEMKVPDLIAPSLTWDANVLNFLFGAEMMNRIRHMPIACRSRSDQLIWRNSKMLIKNSKSEQSKYGSLKYHPASKYFGGDRHGMD